jgi:hypothetical protein
MKLIVKYGFMTLIILQGLFVFLWYINFNLLGLLSWIGRGDEMNPIKLFSPLIVFGVIKICYWFADPMSKLFIIILRWVVVFIIIYLLYWLFLVK